MSRSPSRTPSSGGGGTLNISGAGAKLDSNGGTTLNVVGNSTVNVLAGGTMNTGTALVVGKAEGDGTLLVNGGTVSVATNFVLANLASGAPNGTSTLNSGTITASQADGGLRYGNGSPGGNATGSFTLNGGTLRVLTGSTVAGNFMTGLDSANVKEGGAIIHTNGIATTIAQALVHGGAAPTDGGLTKLGNGTLTLTGNNTYTGVTTVTTGTLILSGSGSINPSSLVSVASGTTVTNNTATALTTPLSLAETATVNGTGTFTTTNLTIVGDLSGGAFSAINSTSSFAASGALAFTLTNTVAGTYDLFSTNPASFSFTSVSVGALPLVDSGGTFTANDGSFSYTFVNGTDALEIAAVPEPGTWVLVGFGLAFLLCRKPASLQKIV